MNLISFRYFLAAAAELNFTRAAKSLYITQQSLSEHIRRLEEEYHVKLFERTPSLRLTEAGAQLRRYALEALDLDARISGVMADVAAEKKGSVSLGMRAFYGRILLPDLIPRFSAAHPGIQLHVTLGRSQDLAGQLLSGTLDLALLVAPYAANAGFTSIPALSDRYCLVIPENILEQHFDMSAAEMDAGNSPDWTALEKAPLIFYKSGTTRECTERFLLARGCRHPNVLIETGNTELQMILCASGCGYTVTYERLWRYYEKRRQSGPRLLSIPLPEYKASGTVISYLSRRGLGHAAQALLDFLRKTAEEL